MRYPLLAAALVLTVGGCAVPTDATIDADTTTTAAAPNDVAPAAAVKPTRTSYKLKVKTLQKQCFGSAGCNVEVRISIGDVDPEALNVAADLSIRVTGGEDPYEDTISIDEDGNYSQPEVLLSTPSASSKVRAKVTAVEVR